MFKNLKLRLLLFLKFKIFEFLKKFHFYFSYGFLRFWKLFDAVFDFINFARMKERKEMFEGRQKMKKNYRILYLTSLLLLIIIIIINFSFYFFMVCLSRDVRV